MLAKLEDGRSRYRSGDAGLPGAGPKREVLGLPQDWQVDSKVWCWLDVQQGLTCILMRVFKDEESDLLEDLSSRPSPPSVAQNN